MVGASMFDIWPKYVKRICRYSAEANLLLRFLTSFHAITRFYHKIHKMFHFCEGFSNIGDQTIDHWSELRLFYCYKL